MKRFLFALLFCWMAVPVRAQLPVIDVAVLAEAVATVAELRRQVDLLLKEVTLSTEIKQNTGSHLLRYERALTKRGLIPTQVLRTYVDQIRAAHNGSGGVTWDALDVFQDAFPMYQNPPDPLAAQRLAQEQTMATLRGTLASLQVHSSSMDQAHDELERLKKEIVLAVEPQQIRDVQANLQVVHARELLLTRQALMTLVNLEAVRAGEAVSQKAQGQMRYDALIGDPRWLGDPSQYDVKTFLKMPGGK